MRSALRRWFVLATAAAIFLGVIGLAIIVGGFAGLVASDAQRWPYEVKDRRLANPKVQPGEPGGLVMRRLIDYHIEDCWRLYERRIVSKSKDGPKAGMVFRLPPLPEERLPVELSGTWQSWSVTLPSDFPCGPAYLAETITAGCTWFQRAIRPLKKPTVHTAFEVVGCPSDAG